MDLSKLTRLTRPYFKEPEIKASQLLINNKDIIIANLSLIN